MIATRSQKVATSSRSWLMKISPMPRSADQIVEDRQHLQLDGDVERRGRLVGDQQIGLAGQHHGDHHPLAHAAGQLVRPGRGDAARVADPHGRQQLAAPAAARRGRAAADGRAGVSSICSPTRITGLSEYFGSCSTMPMRPPRSSRHCARLALQQVDALELSRSAVTTACGGSSPMTARPTVDLPEPLSPTMPSFSRPTAERDAAHRVDRARSGWGRRRAGSRPSACRGGGASSRRRRNSISGLRAEWAEHGGVPLDAGEAERRHRLAGGTVVRRRARRARRRCACRRRSGARAPRIANTISGRMAR